MPQKQIHNPNSGISDEISFKEKSSSKESKQIAQNVFELFKRKEKTLTQLSLLKEKINIDIDNDYNNPETQKEVKRLFEPVKGDVDANYEMGFYYNIKGDSKEGAKHWKKSLEISKKFKTHIDEFLRERILEPIINGYEYKTEVGTLNFILEFRDFLIPIIKEMKKEKLGKKKIIILDELASLLK